MTKYFTVWKTMTVGSIQEVISSQFGWALFVIGKLLRFFIFLAFLFFLMSGVNSLIGYTKDQVLLFYLTFAVIGGIAQMFFREAYRFRQRVVSGDFDFDLTKPIHPLVRNLTGGFDALDLITLPIYFYFLIMAINAVGFTPQGLGLYILLAVNGFLIITAMHVLILSFGIVTSEVDHAVLIYRDLENMARFPINIYGQPLQGILTFIIPLGIIFTIPAQALMGLLSWQMVMVSFLLGAFFLWVSFKTWNNAVKKYSSASS